MPTARRYPMIASPESWFPFVDRSDLDPAHPDAGAVYFFLDGSLKLWASEDCRDTSPEIDSSDTRNVKVLIRRTENRDAVDYAVRCQKTIADKYQDRQRIYARDLEVPSGNGVGTARFMKPRENFTPSIFMHSS
jgi:hypothetical protein